MAQQLPSRDDPLYDYLARERPSPATLMRMPRSADEFLRAFPSDAQASGAIARWKLGDAPSLPPRATLLMAEAQAFAFPDQSDWRTAEATYRIVGTWAIDAHTLLEVVWSDARRRTGENPSAFGAVPYAMLTLQAGSVRGQVGYGTLRWLGGYSGGLLVNDEMPSVPHAAIQFPVRIPLLGEWRFEQFLSAVRAGRRAHLVGRAAAGARLRGAVDARAGGSVQGARAARRRSEPNYSLLPLSEVV
jgi:hypothetical protein